MYFRVGFRSPVTFKRKLSIEIVNNSYCPFLVTKSSILVVT